MIRHLAIIMDGNGRWAQRRGLPRTAGHKAGAETLDRVMHYCRDAGIGYLTVYAFSTENWRRSQLEVTALMRLLGRFVRTKRDELCRNRVRFRVIGRRTDLSARLQRELASLEEATREGEFTLTVALSYGGRDEIVRACRRYAETGGELDEARFATLLDTAGMPDPDLIVRTGGEQRLSNFLLWQAAYAEFYFTETAWPDFSRADFDSALSAYAVRDRRMGGVKQ